MELLNDILSRISGFLWGWPMIVMLLGTHLFLTVSLRFPQRHIFKAIKLSFEKDNDAKGEVSQFGALVTSLAATIGTGNIVGGVKSISKVCEALVPLMAILYILGCIAILFINGHYVWPAIQLICRSAFSPAAMGGGLAGGGIMMAARYGIARGLFSNESGLGSAPIVAAAAKTSNPVRQALVSSTGTFWDTVVIFAMTGVVIVSSILAFPDIDYSNGGVLTTMAFSKIPVIGAPLLAFGSLTFAFSTILGWSYYGESAVEYIAGKKLTSTYRVIFLISVYLGAVVSLDLVWNLADIFNALMAIPNLVSLILLSGVIVKETKKNM